ncbi:MAG: PAS/PAC sensor signal transduction histidine kinase [uncultured bacterium]|nr:MAG: PAS/PAC sensor signal transduction histidine kinase [uncultured bacterium]KKP67725.1 MAG: PAS/PAC sensor signal transduction histidine kinase [Candidatus Moranbacteria bacterium GW2011_GWE1_35_17]KKP84152.1 MAG: PAS/PAC sensor signal transduction histidine kinase [Candidatus Moranbacteria bacterium GW2011_GWF2_35_54]HBR79726.1 hypothetical protein [Candidatus Moranbacteria bacterium]
MSKAVKEVLLLSDLNNRRKENKKSSLVLDMIERAKLEWELTADALPQLICILDKNGKILRANRVFESWNIGYLNEVRGKDLHNTLHPNCSDSNCYLKNRWKVIRNKMIKKGAFRVDARDRFLEKDIRAHFYPIPARPRGKKTIDSFAVMIMQDFTDIKNTEDRLVESYKYIGSINRRLDILLNINKTRLGIEKREIFRNMNNFAMDLFQSQVSLIYKFEKNKECFRLLSASRLPHGYKNKISNFPKKASETMVKLKEKKLVNLVECGGKGTDRFEMDGKFNQFIFVPLMNGKGISGMLVALLSKPRKVSEEDMFFYEMFSFKLSFFLLQMKIM